ncbi:MAG TPA: universal stress protein [Acidimicrobiales bacterium]|nr:universal stress protein [Acidimicrobiales bacterium]
MYERILVALDGSEHSRRALEHAKALALLATSQVRVLHVREEYFIGRAGQVPAEAHQEAAKLVDDAVASLTEAGVPASGMLRASLAGRVAGEILEEAESWDASLVVMGSRGLTDLVGLLLGSTAHKVLHLGKTPVLIVH